MTAENLYLRNYLLHLQERPEYGGLVLLKEPADEHLTSAQISQLHNEHLITRQLAHVPGVRPAYAIEGFESHPVLVMAYIEGNSLAELIDEGSFDLSQKLQLGVQIATILQRIHEEGVMHRDISSSNILVAEDGAPDEIGEVIVIGFGLATTTSGEGVSRPIEVDSMAGSVAYISPEQTGRTNRPIDHRTDLYSLGVTLYELLAGRLPFETDDPMEMVHSHLALDPMPLHEIDASVPRVVSDIVLKLLAKSADDRYRSAGGLRADLSNCLRQLRDTGRIESFEIGADDFSSRLAFSGKLYGREAELVQLATTYDRAAQGNSELLFVAGYSGIGKTALVHGFRGDIISKGGAFAEGKFDQLQRTLPYSAWAQAFTQLINNWLSKSEADLAGWRERILNAVGANGQVLIDVIPSLERIIGPQPDVPLLGGMENQNRFNHTFNRFISSLATTDHPLVVFLDDLQWIDPGSLSLIEALYAGQSRSSFLVIGAYRDNEVGPDHPLVASQDRMSADSERVTVITLGDLALDDTNDLLAYTLQLAVHDCRELGQVLMNRTGGNPFYLRQQLKMSASEGLIRFDRAQRRWLWDETLLQSLQAQDSVVDLMLKNIQALPANTQRALGIAACIGNRFDTSTMNTIIGRSQTDIIADLNPALQGGLILHSNGHYGFLHDRIQEASYALIPVSDLPKRHLEIGRLLLANTAVDDLDTEIFAIIGHQNAGRALIKKGSEKTELAVLNLRAGQKAKNSSAYSDAKKYVEIGLDLLESGSWQEHYELTLSLHNEDGELAYLTGDFDQIATTAAIIHANARTALDRVRIYMTQIEAATAQSRVAEGLDLGLGALRDLGVDIPVQPTPQEGLSLHEKFVGLLTNESMERLDQLPISSDERAKTISTLLAAVMSTAYIANPPLFPILSYNGSILSFEYGLDVWSPFFVGGVALVNIASITPEMPDDDARHVIQFSRRLVELIQALLGNPITARSRTKGLMMLSFTTPWFESYEESVEYSKTTYDSGHETGDWLYGSYGAALFAIQSIANGMDLPEYQHQLSAYLDSLQRMGQVMTPTILAIHRQTADNFMKPSPEPHRLTGPYFNEDEWLSQAVSADDLANKHWLSTGKFILAYHFDRDEALDDYAAEAAEFLIGGPCHLSVAQFYFYQALAGLRQLGDGNETQYPDTLELVEKNLRWMRLWSESVPSTFQHKCNLMSAEMARVTGDHDSALDHYEKAIYGARESGFTHEEALANELFARFWLARGSVRFAGPLMREAHSLYRKWGALAKAEHLAKRYPNLIISRSIVVDEPRTGVIVDQMSGDLDFMTILKTSQAIAGEIELGRLLDLLMANAIENSGAQRGFLLLQEDGQWMIVAQSDLDKIASEVEQPIPVAESDLLSQRVVHYVARTQQTVLLDDATQSGEFVDDPYVRRSEVKSLLCTPLVNQGKTSAVLYLENNLLPGTFSSDRVEMLSLLSSQMAISIDNARTHDHLEQLLEERSRALNSAEAQIRTIFDNSPVGISLTSLDGRFLSINNAIQHMLRISEEEVLQRHVTDFYADLGDRASLLNELQRSGTAQDFGVQLLRNDGTPFFASVNMSRLVLNGDDVLLAIVEDVTSELTAEQQTGALAERERLARELHDSVSQTLFTAGMIADAAPRLWNTDPASGQQNLELLSTLIRGASAEMRSLLLELRPDTLKGQTLGHLLETLVIAARARTQAAVSLNVEGDSQRPEEVVIAFHRIAQESLSNVARHAEASQVVIDLSCDPESTRLCIQDDGRGFDPSAIPAGHLGVGIMGERAQKIGADIKIDSEIGRGTKVSVSWSAKGKESASGDKTEHE